MAALDESVLNLQRFLGVLVQATAALEQVGAHVQESAERFTQLEDEASDQGGGLNDELTELESAIESGRDDVRDALADLTQAAADGRESAEEDRDRLDRAVTDLEGTVDDALEALGDAHSSLTDQGFQPLLETLDEAESELEAQGQEAQQDLEALESAIHDAETQSQAAWDAVDAELDEGVSVLSQGEGSIESEASEGAQGFASAASDLEAACTTLASDVDAIYDALDSTVAQQGQEWDKDLQEDARGALDHVATLSEERLAQPAQVVEDEALASLGHEYADLETVLSAAVATGVEAEPLAAELTKCGTVIGQVDELLSALAG